MCFDDDSHPPIPISETAASHGEDVVLRAGDGTEVPAYLAEPEEHAQAQVVILPDARGLHNFYKELAMRFADVGMRALTFDFFARTSALQGRSHDFDYMAHIQQLTNESFGLDLDVAVQAIRAGEGRDLPTFSLGFCMGGSLSFWAGTRGYNLAGLVGFYASLSRHFGPVKPASEYASLIRSPVLGLFGGADPGIPQSDIDAFGHQLEEIGVRHELVVYPGAPHSFFDRKAQEFATASADAWHRVQGFIADQQAVRV
jgi:carboxymethylenebutenolidase